MKLTSEVLTRSEKIQEEMHHLIEQVKATKRCKHMRYEDLLAVVFMLKIAELEDRISVLEEGIMPTGGNS